MARNALLGFALLAALAAFESIAEGADAVEPIAFRLLHVDGTWRSVEAFADRPRNWSGPERVVVTARDLGPRERLERELGEARRMEVLGRFAGGVAHDFDHLLTAIQGYTSLLLRDLRPGEPQYEGLEEIRQSSEPRGSRTSSFPGSLPGSLPGLFPGSAPGPSVPDLVASGSAAFVTAAGAVRATGEAQPADTSTSSTPTTAVPAALMISMRQTIRPTRIPAPGAAIPASRDDRDAGPEAVRSAPRPPSGASRPWT